MEEIKKNDNDSQEKILMELTGVSKNFGKLNAVSDMTFSLRTGTIFALLGENGAGKTTTIKMLFGQTAPDSGTIRVLGLDPVREKDALEIRRKVGYVPDQPALYEWMKVGEMGRFAAAFYPEGYWKEFLRQLDFFSIAPDLPIRSLSKGKKAQVSLALALANDPDLLILDEPTSGLDPIVRRSFLQSMADRTALGKSVFLSSHQITEVERIADRVGIMKNSKLLFDESLETLKNEIKQLVLTFQEAAPVTPPEGLFHSFIRYSVEGRTATVIGRNPVHDFADRLPDSVLNYDLQSLGLEDIFIASSKQEDSK